MKNFTRVIISFVTCHLSFVMLSVVEAQGQAPQGIPYQAVARNTIGNVIATQNISLRFSIHDATAGGAVVYKETQSATTNALGLFNVNVGQGTPVTGTFVGINWATNAKFMQVEMDAAGGTAYVDMGTQQMMSVPYALYAGSSNVPNGTQNGQTLRWNGTAWVTDIMLTNTGTAVGIGTAAPIVPFHTKGNVRHESLGGVGVRPVYADSSGNLSTTVNATGTVAPATAIPDNGCTTGNGVTSSITLSGYNSIVSSSTITVRVNITHPAINTVSLYLVAPTGQILKLKTVQSTGTNMVNTVFTDTASSGISTAVGPATGSFKPVGSLTTFCTITPTVATFNAFGGGFISPNGIWALKVFDGTVGNTGTFNDWSIYINGGTEGADNYLPKWDGGTLTNTSSIYDNGSITDANVGIGTAGAPASSAVLELKSTDKGLLIPRMTTNQRNGILNPSVGLQVFNTDNQCINIYDGSYWIETCGLKVTGTTLAPDYWAQKANGATARFGAVGFSIGTKGYIGTGNSSGNYKNDFWEYDAPANSWTQKADFGGTARFGAVGFSIGTKGYIGTGYDGTYKNDFWEYDATTNTWAQKAGFGGTARYRAVGFSIGSKGYVGTGAGGVFKNDFWEYDVAANTWTQKANFGGTARDLAVGFSIGTMGYIGTGYDGASKNDFWEYDAAANTWTQKANFGGTARLAAIGFSIGAKGYIGTGDDGVPKNDFWEYDAASNIWTQNTSFGGTARTQAVGFILSDKGYIGTGYDGAYKNDFWEYTPASVVYDYGTPTVSGTAAAVDYGAWTVAGNTVSNSNSGNVGIGTSSPTSMLSVGTNSPFQVNSTGNIVKINNVAASFPPVQGATNTLLSNNGSGTLSWSTLSALGGVTAVTASAPLTSSGGATPNITLGVAGVANGGTGASSYTTGDILYASAAGILSRLADIATGNALISGGANLAPGWGKIGLATHVTGTLPVANGGSGIASLTGLALGNGTLPFTSVTTSAGLAGALSDETGSGLLVFGTSPTLSTPTISSFSNAAHNHSNAAGGGQINLTNAVTGALPVANGGSGTGTSFTAGSVVFAGASGVYSQNNSQFFWDNSNARLGIGTATPLHSLEVVGINAAAATTGFAANGIVRIHPTGTSLIMDIGTYSSSGAHGWIQMRESTDYTSNWPLSINPNGGNVGIGITVPVAKLDILGEGSTSSTASLNIRNSASTLLMHVRDDGNVAIGPINPGAKLDVFGNFRLGTSGTILTNVIKGTGTTASVSVSANSRVLQNYTLANAAVGATVMVSPSTTFPLGLVIDYARVVSSGTVEIAWHNVTAAAVTLTSGLALNITVIQ